MAMHTLTFIVSLQTGSKGIAASLIATTQIRWRKTEIGLKKGGELIERHKKIDVREPGKTFEAT